MAFQKQWGNPYSTDPATQAYFRIAETNLNHAEQRGRVVVLIYTNKSARDAGMQPIGAIAYDFQADTPKETFDPVTGNKNFQFPGYVDLMKAVNALVPAPGVGLFDAIKGLLYTLIANDPNLVGATSV